MKDDVNPGAGRDPESTHREGTEATLQQQLDAGRKVMARSSEALENLAGTEWRSLRGLVSGSDLLGDHMRDKREGEKDDAEGTPRRDQTSMARQEGRDATVDEQLEAGRRVLGEYSEALRNLAGTKRQQDSPAMETTLGQAQAHQTSDSDVAKPENIPASVPQTSYDADFFEWTQETAAKIRQGRFNEIDVAALAEEIEDLGKREQREVDNRVRTIMVHLLELQFEPEMRTKSCAASIFSERVKLEDTFKLSGSLIQHGRKELPRIYSEAVRLAVAETGLPKQTFPSDCPYTYEQILDSDFYADVWRSSAHDSSHEA